ncbi:LamB/YcsF family protein [Cellulosimicrobium cellulans]|uniref:LamB/YcsF family protein n=1 Tax=Cellulosimicrobium cellulans TaxID=1710 RepID=UPI001C3F63B3|nr:5-oxoprolinase subunit PxpA [Cellulosimicrobium cellulans]
MTRIDLNADLGEGFGRWTLADDEALLGLVTSANVACGFHAGDATTMRTVTRDAVARGVRVGAHVSYLDLAGFGRRFMEVDPVQLADDLLYQLAALDGFARLAGDRVRYVKPHGALYNAIVHHEVQARAVVDAVRAYDPALHVVGLSGSEVLRLADAAGVPTVREAFADRGYLPTGELVPRGLPGAVVHDAEQVARRVVELATSGTVPAADGSSLRVEADSVCVHSDTPGAVGLLSAVRVALADAGVEVRSFVAAGAVGPGSDGAVP